MFECKVERCNIIYACMRSAIKRWFRARNIYDLRALIMVLYSTNLFTDDKVAHLMLGVCNVMITVLVILGGIFFGQTEHTPSAIIYSIASMLVCLMTTFQLVRINVMVQLIVFGMVRAATAETIQVDTPLCKFPAKRGLAQLFVPSLIAITAANLSMYKPLASAVVFIVAAITSPQHEFSVMYCAVIAIVVDWGLYRYILLVVPVSVIGIQFIVSMVRSSVVADTPVVADTRTVDLAISIDQPATE